ncbi:MAG: iron chelate uptake ABC transporter family permease subunit [Sediminispirochaetaceae bacterium]
MNKKIGLLVGLITGSALLLFLLDIASGSVYIPATKIVRILTGMEEGEASLRYILFHFRLPRAITAAAAGAALSISGLFMQTLFRNPLAGPSVLGITAGANLGVALTVMALGSGAGAGFAAGIPLSGRLLVAASSVAGAAVVLLIILAVARLVGSITVVLLFGIMFGYVANSLVSIFIHFSSAERVQSYIQWSFGSFDAAVWSDIRILVPVVAAVFLCAVFLAKPLNAFLLGEEYAGSMGVSVRSTRTLLVLVAALSAGVVHAFCGPVTFLGVAVPHLARGVLGTSDHGPLIPTVAAAGASTALAADILSHLPGGPSVLPLNAVTALIGAPVVVWVLVRSRSGRYSV